MLPDEKMFLSPATIDAESAWFGSLGLDLPADPLLLAAPFAPPLTSRSFLVPSSWHWRDPPELVSARDLALDLDILEVAMEKAYAGWEPAELAGWDWRSFFERWREDLARHSGGAIPIGTAFAPWAELMRFQLDNHSGPIARHRFSGFSRTVRIPGGTDAPVTAWRNREGRAGPRDASDPAHQPRSSWVYREGELHRESVLTYPSNLGEWEAVRTAGSRRDVVPVRNGIVKKPDEADAVAFRWLDADTAYLRIPTLSYALACEVTARTEWLPEEARHARSLVFDLRGNEGGAASVMFFVLRRLIGWEGVETALSFSLRRKDSCLSRALIWGFAQAKLKGCQPPLPGHLRATLQQALNGVVAWNSPECTVRFHDAKAKWGYREHAFPSKPAPGQPSILALADNRCGSDGEFLVYLLASLPGTAVAGVNTAGVGGFARPGYFVLPRTGVPFRLATALADLYGDGRSFEGYGFDPDILIDVEEDLSDAQLAELAANIRAMS